jgi:hypothetical protein
MAAWGFNVTTSDPNVNRHFLVAYPAKQYAQKIVEEGTAKWAKVTNCDCGSVIKSCGDRTRPKKSAANPLRA